MLGMVFDEALLRAVATDAGAAEAALDRLRRGRSDPAGRARPRAQPLPVHARARARGGVPESPARPPDRAARAGRPRARARRRPAPGATERSGSARPPLEPRARQGARARATWWPPATGRGRSTPTTMRSATTSARCARSPTARTATARCRRCASGSRDLLALSGRRAEALAHYEAVRQELETAADRAGAARLHRKIGGLHWEAGDRERASACFASGLERLGRRRQLDRARAAVPGDRPPRVSGRRQCRRHRVGRAGARRSGERGGDRQRLRARPRGSRNAGASLQHAGRGARAHRPPRRGGRPDRAEHRARRGARSAAGDLPRLHQSRRALQLARSAPQHRDLPARARDRQEGGRSRLPVAALCQPCRGLLRADRSMRGGRRRGGAEGRRPRPPAGIARSPGGAADRPGPDPPVPRRARPGLRLVSRRRWVWPSGSESRSSSSPATTVSLRSISMPGTRRWPRSIWRSRRRCASGPGSSPTPSWSCRFSVNRTSADEGASHDARPNRDRRCSRVSRLRTSCCRP